MKKLLTTTLLLAGASLFMTGCTSTAPRRIETGSTQAITTIGLDMADLMDTASRAVAELLVHPSLAQFEAKTGYTPRLDVGAIKNQTQPYVPIVIEQVSERVMEALLDSGKITLVAKDAGARKAERLDRFMSDDKVGGLMDQADFHLEGAILNQFVNQRGIRERNYAFMLRLNDRNLSQVWKRTLDITKQSGR